MMRKLLQLSACILFLIACNNSGDEKNKTTKSRADSLMDEVMEGHNAGMAKMNKIAEAQKRVQRLIDSIAKLPSNLKKNLGSYKTTLDSTLDRLKYADYAMNRWMEEFNMDSEINNTKRRIEYLESEKIKISNVKDAMTRSLQKADSLLKEKF
jgi:thiamine biosynthesis lipoprotein ApbE